LLRKLAKEKNKFLIYAIALWHCILRIDLSHLGKYACHEEKYYPKANLLRR
jgi:hypothetical protein